MNRKVRYSIALALVVASAAHAQSDVVNQADGVVRCNDYLGKTIRPQTFDVLTTLASSIPVTKDEFETTAAFEVRRTAAAKRLPSTFIVRSFANLKFLNYDADSQTLNVGAYFFRFKNVDYGPVFARSPLPAYHNIDYGKSYDNIDIVIDEEERVVDRYRGVNAYGASVEVSKIQRDTTALWERKAQGDEELFTDQTPGLNPSIGSIPASEETARMLKSSGRAAIVVAPKPPYFAYGSQRWEPRFDKPTEVNNNISVIVADIQCGLLIDETDKVWGAWNTR